MQVLKKGIFFKKGKFGVGYYLDKIQQKDAADGIKFGHIEVKQFDKSQSVLTGLEKTTQKKPIEPRKKKKSKIQSTTNDLLAMNKNQKGRQTNVVDFTVTSTKKNGKKKNRNVASHYF